MTGLPASWCDNSVMQKVWKNPFQDFLSDAEAVRRLIKPTPEVHSDEALVHAFVRVWEQRTWIFDILDRVDMLAHCFDRLHALSTAYRETDEQVEQQRRSRDKFLREAMLLISFAYYEISTLVS